MQWWPGVCNHCWLKFWFVAVTLCVCLCCWYFVKFIWKLCEHDMRVQFAICRNLFDRCFWSRPSFWRMKTLMLEQNFGSVTKYQLRDMWRVTCNALHVVTLNIDYPCDYHTTTTMWWVVTTWGCNVWWIAVTCGMSSEINDLWLSCMVWRFSFVNVRWLVN